MVVLFQSIALRTMPLSMGAFVEEPDVIRVPGPPIENPKPGTPRMRSKLFNKMPSLDSRSASDMDPRGAMTQVCGESMGRKCVLLETAYRVTRVSSRFFG